MRIDPRWSNADRGRSRSPRRADRRRGGSNMGRALVLPAVLGPFIESPSMAQPLGVAESHRLESRDRKVLLEQARATWRSFERTDGPGRAPGRPDRVRRPRRLVNLEPVLADRHRLLSLVHAGGPGRSA